MTASILFRAVTYRSKGRTAATGDYDFGPRRYISAAPFWRAPDPKAHDYPNISPYAFCAANPIRYSDPTGMVFTEAAQKYADELQSYAISAFMDALRNQRFDIADKFNATLVEIKKMAESDVLFHVMSDESGELENGISFFHVSNGDGDSDAVIFALPGDADVDLKAHEFKHGYQFLQGETDLAISEWGWHGEPVAYDIYDELEAYDRGALFGGDKKTLKEIESNSLYQGKALLIPTSIYGLPKQQIDRLKNNISIRATHIDGKTYYKKPKK